MSAFVGNLPVVAREPSAAERRKNALVCCAEDKKGGWKKIGMAIAAGFAFLGPPNAAQAVRGSGSMFRIGEKASEFVLPSEKEAQLNQQQRGETQEKLKNAAGAALKVAPYVVATGAVVGGGYFALQRFQQNQVKRFQKDLKGVSTTFGDSDFTSPPPKKKQTVDTAAMAKTILEKRKYKFRERKPARDRSAQVDVDLFNDRTEDTKPKADVGDIFADPVDAADTAEATTGTPEAGEEGKDGELEFAVKKYLSGGRGVSAVVAATAAMSAIQAAVAVQTIGLAVLEGLVVDVIGKIKIMMSGAAALPPVEAVAKIAATAAGVRALVKEAFSKDITVRYEGDSLTEELAEEIYRIFSVSVLSQGTAQDMTQVKELEDLQTFLGIPADRARTIYEEVVKEMMKEAMNQANLDPQARKMMEDLRSSFGQEAGRAPGDTDDDVMKMMYALQQLLTEQGINEDDAREMREMMKSMGLDAKDLVQNVEMLVNVLGPDAKPLIEQLKKLLVEDEPSNTTDVAAQEVQDAASTSVKQLEPIEEAAQNPVDAEVEVIKELSPEEAAQQAVESGEDAPKSWADVIKDFKPTEQAVKEAVEEVEAAAEQVAAAVEEATGAAEQVAAAVVEETTAASEQVTAAMDDAKAAGLEFTVTNDVSAEEVAAVQAEFQEVFQAAQQMTEEEEAAEMADKAASAVEETSVEVAAEEPAEPVVPPYESPVESTYEWTSVSADKTQALDNVANDLFSALNDEAKKVPKLDDLPGSGSDKMEAK